MVFVEYESEVEEESARVKALLEKLRIDATVLVFWLASGHLNTYELMINGRTNDVDTEIIVNDALKDEEWWEELQTFRGQSGHMSSSQEMPKKPDIGILSKLGVSVGIHTHHLSDDVLQEPSSDDKFYTDAESSDTDGEYDLGLDGPMSHGDVEYGDSTKQPLLAAAGTQSAGESSARVGRERKPKAVGSSSQMPPSYGTMSTSQTLVEKRDVPTSRPIPEVKEIGSSPSPQGGKDSRDIIEAFPSLGPLEVPRLDQVASRRSRSMSPARPPGVRTPRDGAMTPIRPAFSRQSSAARFSSRPVPETTIITEAEGSKISFAPAASNPATPRLERPTHSRQSSWGKFSSRPVPDTKASVGDEAPRTIQFAEQPVYNTLSASHSRHHSRQGSQYSTFGQGDVNLSIPELVESYKNNSAAGNESEGGSTYSTMGFSLSFNDLPSRAQHLILNELMRQHSKDTAVLMSTLPIPSEGTSLDEMATIQYLSDVEVLCNELPPTLMVLSNNMTVTVSL